MTQARQKQISLVDTPYYHCIARCVRRNKKDTHKLLVKSNLANSNTPVTASGYSFNYNPTKNIEDTQNK